MFDKDEYELLMLLKIIVSLFGILGDEEARLVITDGQEDAEPERNKPDASSMSIRSVNLFAILLKGQSIQFYRTRRVRMWQVYGVQSRQNTGGNA